MDNTTAMYVAVALVCTGLMGAAFARWRRALSDWRKTVAGIPGLRKATFEQFWRTFWFALIVAGLVYLWLKKEG